MKNIFYLIVAISTLSCQSKKSTPADERVASMNLKRGNIIACGPPEKQWGSVSFETTCSGETKKDFNIAIALLHSFEYDEAEKMFAKIIDESPNCAMAYWGVAMCNYHQVWPSPPAPADLEKGNKAITMAQSLPHSKREGDYIDAMAVFYKDWGRIDHHTRSLKFEHAMEDLYARNPDDKEAAIFYALALNAAADPADKTYKNQKKAGQILTSLYPGEPNHPGIVHYIIHSYDYPELAELALPAARKYASIAPSSAHALHMPSHIFTRLGLWDECIQSNLNSIASARCYAEGAGIKGHWDEELHGMDYLVYAYLQKGENAMAKEQLDYLESFEKTFPENFKVAYAFAAIPARYYLENHLWKNAAELKLYPENFPWSKFPWQTAIYHFARLMGSAHTNNISEAKSELNALQLIYDTLTAQKDPYKANQVMIQIKTGNAWIELAEGKKEVALADMRLAADMEDKTEKSPVTPGEVLPAKELLADMLMLCDKPKEALVAYEADLLTHKNRFNGLYGAAVASEKIADINKATGYYQQLINISDSLKGDRPELNKARLSLKKKSPDQARINRQ